MFNYLLLGNRLFIEWNFLKFDNLLFKVYMCN